MIDRWFTTVVVFAFRYALGRHSTAPSIVADFIKDYIEQFVKWEIEMIIKEIEEEAGRQQWADIDSQGERIDIEIWEDLKAFLTTYLKGGIDG